MTIAAEREEDVERALTDLASAPPPAEIALPDRSRVPADVSCDLDDDAFRARVLAAKEYIAAGDAFQVVLARTFSVAREGRDLSIITYSAMVWKSLEAAELLEKEGVSVEVLDLRSLLPMDDEAILATVKKTNRVLIVHEDTVTGGIAGEITARIQDLAFEWLDAPVKRVAAHDVPLPYAPQLEDFVLPQTTDIVRAARWLAAY